MNKRTDGEVQAYVDGYNACFEKFRETLLQRNVGADKAIRKMETLKEAVNSVLLTENVGMCQHNVGEMSEQMPSYNSIKTELNGDLISRQAVITMLNKIENAVEDGDGFQFNEWIEYAKQIPSFENMASWVELDDYPCEDWECDNCGFVITGVEEPYRFCPNCGKKMWK